MATRRARDAFDKAEQERRVAEQREVLRQRAAQRAKDRADERRHGGAFQPKNTRDKRAVDGATNAGDERRRSALRENETRRAALRYV